MKRYWRNLLVGILLCAGQAILVSTLASAQADVGIISGAPLKIQANQDGSLQVWHNRYTNPATFGSAGSGFNIALDTDTYGPQAFTMDFIDQSPTTGSGASGDPFRSTLRQRLAASNASLDVTQTVSYVNGANYFQLDWAITNSGSASTCFKAYHAADLYFANDDFGYGYYNAATGSIGGYDKAKDWFMVFTPITPASHYEEAYYATIWDRLSARDDLKDTIVTDYIDNGAALQWNLCLSSGQSKTISDAWSFGESEVDILASAQQAAGGGSGWLGQNATAFRPEAPGSPALTTTIPTPLDISLAPPVVEANLLWAALATVLFVVAVELFNRTLAENEALFQRLFKPFKAIAAWSKKPGLAERLGRPAWYEWLKLAIIIVIYGINYSFLDRTWNPLSLNGVWLFISMAIAFGVVGLADDITEWNTARRWKLPTRISIRPGNLLLAVISMVFARALVLMPGVMFGMPEAFEIDQQALDGKRRNRLLLLAGGVLIGILLVSWLPTILTDLVLKANASPSSPMLSVLLGIVAGLQSLLLLIFAVTVENLFLHMLALPDTIGEMIKRRSRIVWFVALLLATYVFLQTLLNPVGDLAQSLQTSNLRAFLGTIGLSTLVMLVLWLLMGRRKRLAAANPPVYPRVEDYNPQQATGNQAVTDASGVPMPPAQVEPIMQTPTAPPPPGGAPGDTP